MTDTQKAMRDAQSLHRLRMMPKDQQDVAIIMHYAAAVAVAMQGSRLVESKRFGGDSEYLNEAISYVADLLRKVHQTDFGTTLPCNGMVCTAQSAEKIARLEAENARLLAANRDVKAWSDAAERDLAAAELSNKQLRDVLEDFARGQLQVPNFEAYVQATAKSALAQPISTEALDAYVASKLPAWQPIETAPKDGTEIDLLEEINGYFNVWTGKWLDNLPNMNEPDGMKFHGWTVVYLAIYGDGSGRNRCWWGKPLVNINAIAWRPRPTPPAPEQKG